MAESDIRWVFMEEQFVGGLREGGTKQVLSAGKASSLFLITQSCVCVCVWDGLTLSAPQSAAINNCGAVHNSQVFFSNPISPTGCFSKYSKGVSFFFTYPSPAAPQGHLGTPAAPLNQPVHIPFWPRSVEFSITWRHATYGNLGAALQASSSYLHHPSLILTALGLHFHCCRSGFVVLTFGCPLSIVPHCPPSNRTSIFFRRPKHPQPRSFQGRWLHPLYSQSRNRLWLA